MWNGGMNQCKKGMNGVSCKIICKWIGLKLHIYSLETTYMENSYIYKLFNFYVKNKWNKFE